MTISEGQRSRHIQRNRVAIKMITTLTIKKVHEQPQQLQLLPRFQSSTIFSPPPLCPGRPTWLGTRFQSCRRHSSQRSGCHRTWSARKKRWETTSHNGSSNSASEGGRWGGEKSHSTKSIQLFSGKAARLHLPDSTSQFIFELFLIFHLQPLSVTTSSGSSPCLHTHMMLWPAGSDAVWFKLW